MMPYFAAVPGFSSTLSLTILTLPLSDLEISSKAGAISLTQSLAKTLGEYNINVNAVCPGGIITAMADQFNSDRKAMQESLISPRTLRRPLLPEDIGNAVVFFASERSRNITGQALNVDCGEVFN